ncbi:hypothetical protein CHLRE_17g703250v5 [Chlamydomonas reinhardtii]|uniref:Sugar phosphate transporter domain-containing protein n=1 Tax=Chlamydomonas reinhardtii TaxID=3055 RepID=A0A2K3CP33_CHLRE|nr:uncharacterized protein CHLRE_17g703250v5 [Chlamydomonas reinhardtii]PNW70042.1 hypothetical protein CHLRE_17g703250v5 [Chlamydomonas reinhardtii]
MADRNEKEPLLVEPRSPDIGLRRVGAFSSMYIAATPFLGIGSAVLYGCTAVSMNFVNKASMQMLPLPNVVMVGQMVATFLLLHPMLEAGMLGFPKFSWRTCRRLFWITVLYTANVGFALFGLKTLNIPMYNVLKRLTPMMVLTVKSIIRKRWPRLEISLSVLLVVAGCVVAGIGDLSFDMLGYLFALLSCTMQAAYLLLVEFQGEEGVSTSEMLYYNAITSLPFLLLVCAATGEAAALPAAYSAAVAAHGPVTLWGTLASCSFFGCLLNFALFLCTVNNSALTTTIVGVIKGVVAVFLGFFLLGGVKFSAVNVAGISLNTLGAVWYTVLKYQEKRSGAKKAQLASASTDPLSSFAKDGASSGNLLLPAAAGGGVAASAAGGLAGGDEEEVRDGGWAGRQPAAVRRHAAA